MNPAILAALLAARLSGVVDRIEGDVAVVEWREDAFGELPVSSLPPGVGEGDLLWVTLDADEHGPLVAIDEHRLSRADGARAPPTVGLPPETPLRAGSRYALRVERAPAVEPPRRFNLNLNNSNGSDL